MNKLFRKSMMLKPIEAGVKRRDYLFKKGGLFGETWQLRHFSFHDDGRLVWRENEVSEAICREINLKDYRFQFEALSREDTYWCFRFRHHSKKKTYVLGSPDKQVAQTWVELFRDYFSLLNNRIDINSLCIRADKGMSLHKEFQEIDISELEFSDHQSCNLNKLGSGASGVVYKAKWQGIDVAAKVLIGDIDAQMKEDFFREMKILKDLRHDNVISYYGCSVSAKELVLVTKYENGGDLATLIFSKEAAPYDYRSIALQISAGMRYLHSQKIIHRDLKPQNVLLTAGLRQVKICDFGLSEHGSKFRQQSQSKGEKESGTPAYLAPEADKSFPADVFSFSIVLWELIHRVPIFAELKFSEEFERKYKSNDRPKPPAFLPPQERQILVNGWSTDPARRPSFLEIHSVYSSLPPSDLWAQYEIAITPLRDGLTWGEAKAALQKVFDRKQSAFDVFKRFFCGNIKLNQVDTTDEEDDHLVIDPDVASRFMKHFRPLVSTAPDYFAISEAVSPAFQTGYTIRDLISLCALEYFLGSVSAEKAEDLLDSQADGTFLLRFSINSGRLTFSFNYNKEFVGHIPVYLDHGSKFYFLEKDRQFPNLISLTQYYASNPLPNPNNDLKLYFLKQYKGFEYFENLSAQ